ncbi:MAG TPA: hypothetical protein VLF94_05935 [Chlamydiales bacterium]|nr:hypothetical protein [Chlamydiales bacterium]
MNRFFILTLLIPLFSFAGIDEDRNQGPLDCDEITEEWLLEEGAFAHETHHVAVFKRIFKNMKIKTLLEFGLGYPTKFFLDRCNKVISVDIITHGYGPETMRKFLSIYAEYSNWIPIAYFSGYLGCDYGWAPYKHYGSDSAYKATSYRHANHKSYAPIDDFYLTELNVFITNLLRYNKANAAFIGHAIFLRGDFVTLLFNKVPLIVAHNSDNRYLGIRDDIYGLFDVVTPDNYEEIFFPVEGGTTVWIMKKEEWKGIIEDLKAYAHEI